MENTRSELIEFILENYYEGNRYSFLIRLAGTFARLGISKEVLIDIYNKYLKNVDDENRVRLIDRTYERWEKGLPIMTLDYSDHVRVSKLLGISSVGDHRPVNGTYMSYKYKPSPLSVSELSKYIIPLDRGEHRLHCKYILYNRRLPESVFEKWKFYVSTSEPDRLCVVNFVDESHVDIILGRSIFDRYPKYKVLYGNTSYVLWNYNPNTLKRVVVEGIFDVMTVESYISGVNAVALLGKSVNRYKLSLLRNSEEVTIMLDSDVKEEELEDIVRRLAKYIPVFVCKLPKGKDPSDLAENIVDVFSERELVYKGGVVHVQYSLRD